MQLKSIVKPSSATKQSSGSWPLKGSTQSILLCRGDLLLFQQKFSSGTNFLKLEKGHLNFSQISVYGNSSTNLSLDRTSFLWNNH